VFLTRSRRFDSESRAIEPPFLPTSSLPPLSPSQAGHLLGHIERVVPIAAETLLTVAHAPPRFPERRVSLLWGSASVALAGISCRTLSASILLVHPLRHSKTLLVLRHACPLCPIPLYLLPSFPPLARDQLSEVGPISQDLSRISLTSHAPFSGQPDGDTASLTLTTDRSMWHTLPPSPLAKRTKLAKLSSSANVLSKRLPRHHHPQVFWFRRQTAPYLW